MARASIWHRTRNALYWGAEGGSGLGCLAGIAYSLFVLPGMPGVGLISVIIPPIFGYFGGAIAGAALAAGSTLLAGAVGTLTHPFSSQSKTKGPGYTINAPAIEAKYQKQMHQELVRERKAMRAEMMHEIAANYEPKSKVSHLERLLAERERQAELDNRRI